MPLMTSQNHSNETLSLSAQSSTNHFTSDILDPSPTSNNGAQDPTSGGLKPSSLSNTRIRATSLTSTSHEYPVTSSTPNITSPVLLPVQTSSTSVPSPMTSAQSNFTTDVPVPITVFPISNADTSTSITYIATNTVDSDNQPTDVWKCQGDLCDTSSSKSCIIPAFCADEPDIGQSWGLCCGFIPLPVPGGAALLPGGPPSPPVIGPPVPPGPPGPPAGGGGGSGGGSGSGSNSNTEDDKNNDDKSHNGKDNDQDEKNTFTSASTAGRSTSLSTTRPNTATSTESTSSDATSSSERSTSTSKSETCSQAATASTCTMTVSIFTPTATGTSTPTPETKTIKTCSTFQSIDSCPRTISTTVTTITASTTDAIASPIEHYWDWDGQHNWLEVQQSVLEGLETASSSPFSSITTTDTTSETTASVPASITAVPSTTTTQDRITVTREPPATAAPSVTTTDPAPIIAVITLPTTLVTLRKYLCTPSYIQHLARPPMALLLSANDIIQLNDALRATYHEQSLSVYQYPGPGA
ncbi:uncharacterized protein LDX57_007468 [Aspergillus melleus]|uniref:uncharacterized protein n=1 Tax=Aspergillus melleus TaxID=138277 RepID=UPI001E8ECD57|nr:uncharacterized protein LDX57_007468 [Aspergillus melleus]KAH8429796.1 hypothetical protein LDX57_007468 [Aspergillus melleus]